ncbi:MAG: hypothetical protein ACREVH_11720 [Gammaproteobacteria bacterium]
MFAVTGIFLTAALVLWSGVSAVRDTMVIVDPAQTYQVMNGWEVTARLWEQDKRRDRYDSSWLQYRDLIFERLVNELGINRIRIEIRSGAENPVDYWTSFRHNKIGYKEAKRHRYEKINDNDDPNVLNPDGFQFSEMDDQVENIVFPLKRLLEANGEKLFVNLCYVDFRGTDLKGNIPHALQPEEYAELIHAAFVHLKQRYDMTPDAFEVILEPDNSDYWRGREIGLGMVATAKRLKEAGFSPKFIAPSTAAAIAAPEYLDEMLAVPHAADIVSTFSYHRYDSLTAALALPQILERARKFGRETAMLEYLTGGAEELHADLTEANVSAWQQFGIAFKDLGKPENDASFYYFVDIRAPGRPRIRKGRRTSALAQYFRFIRAGAVRIGAKSDHVDSKPVAFRNPDGRHIAVVQAKRPGLITIMGLPAGSYGIRYTTETEIGKELPVVRLGPGESSVARLPEKGVVTFYQMSSVQSADGASR